MAEKLKDSRLTSQVFSWKQQCKHFAIKIAGLVLHSTPLLIPQTHCVFIPLWEDILLFQTDTLYLCKITGSRFALKWLEATKKASLKQIKYTGCLPGSWKFSAQHSDTRIITNWSPLAPNVSHSAIQITVLKPHRKIPRLEETVKQMVSFLRPVGFVQLVLNSYPMPWICN